MSLPQQTHKEPLGLPKGSVRSMITLVTLVVYFALVFIQMFMGKIIPETMNTIVIAVVAFYFGVRSNEMDIKPRAKK